MPPIWKLLTPVLLVLLFSNGTGLQSGTRDADRLFDAGAFQEALKEYERVFSETDDPEVRWKAFHRACGSLTYLYRFGEAADRLISTPVPEEMPHRARILLLKAELLRSFLIHYPSVQRRDVIDEQDGKDVFRLTPNEIKREIRSAYEELWRLRSQLVKLDLRKEEYFLLVEDIDWGMYPTLFDYTILSWTDFLLEVEASDVDETKGKPEAGQLLVEEFKREVRFDDPAVLLAAELLEEASRFSEAGRLEAAERWRIKRLLLPMTRTDAFDLRALAPDTAVYDPQDYQECAERARGVLVGWMDAFRTEEAKAEAGYEVAVILNGAGKPAEAVALCRKIEGEFPTTHASRHAHALRSSIEMPTISLRARAVLPPAREALSITTKNLEKVHFRLYRVTPQKLRDGYFAAQDRKYGHRFRGPGGYSHLLSLNWCRRDWGREWLESYLEIKEPYKEWSIPTGDEGDYASITTTVSPPELKEGVYLALACGDRSFDVGSSLLAMCCLNVTDFVLIGTAGFTTEVEEAYYDFIEGEAPNKISDEGFYFYTVDARTGQPVEGARIDAGASSHNQPVPESTDLRTNAQGVVSLPLEVGIAPHDRNYYTVDPLAKSGDCFSYWARGLGLSYSSPNPLALFIETDRPIYRPGHTVQAKVSVVSRVPGGFRTLSDGGSVTVSAFDPNRREFFTESVPLNEFGSVGVTLEIPHGALLGMYTLTAQCQAGRFDNSAAAHISVEEYRRPEFEIVLDPAVEAWKYGEPVEIEGHATYYFGGPVADAPIKYRVKRRPHIPWCYRYWFRSFSPATPQEIATGEVRTDARGYFAIPFTPTPPPQEYGGNIPDIAEFVVEVEGRDSGGRTVEVKESYKAGENAIYVAIEPRKGFYLETETIGIDLKRLTVNDGPAPGVSSYEVFALADTSVESGNGPGQRDIGNRVWIPPLDVQMKDVPVDTLIVQGNVHHDKEGKAAIVLPPMGQGAYRITVKSQDKWGGKTAQSRVLVVAKGPADAVPVMARSVTLVEEDEYEIGDTARCIIGSGFGSGVYHVELWAGEHFLSRRLIQGDLPVRLIEIPVTQQMKGGFALRWFGVKEFDIHSGQAAVSVPWTEKKLKLDLEPFTEVLEPGQTVSWGVRVNDYENRPVRGEVLALMYDRSLEYYTTYQRPWLDGLYAAQATPVALGFAALRTRAESLPIEEGKLGQLLKAFREPPDEPNLPGPRIFGIWRAMRRLDVVEKSEACCFGVRGGRSGEFEALSFAGGIPLDLAAAQTRKKFADTGFFRPHIVTSAEDGRASFEFAAPEQLTSWRIKLFAVTADAKEGTLVEEAVTRKDLMVRVDLPRYFREKDKGTVTAIVHNESDRTLEGRLSIDFSENGKTLNRTLGIETNRKSFHIRPHSLASFNWAIQIPAGVRTYRVRVAAAADGLSDAEERELPILPSRERLIESAFVSLTGSGSKALEISLEDDPTRTNESMVLQIEPQLALSILNTIPFLVEYPHQCVEQTLNKYVPLSIVNEIYRRHPAIKEAVGKIPKRTTRTPPWEKDDPRRMIALIETPWVWQSKGRPTPWPIIDLLNPEIVEANKEKLLRRLEDAQYQGGSFPWWPGGEPDPYMTLYVLSGLAEARRYGVEVPDDMVRGALRYVNKKIPLLLKPEERQLALVAFAAYVVTSFSEEDYSEAGEGHEAARSWVVFLERHLHALTPFGKAYLAYTHLRLGDRQRAEELLDLAMDGVREDPIAGVYWTPEKYSWVWYSDSVEKHAFFLRTLQELRPEDKRIPGMVRWLLFNRKGTVWKSTKASVAAVYALLDYLNQLGALASDEAYKVTWGKKTYSEVIRADDWLDEPIRWQESGFEITPEMSKAVIEKEGPGLAFAGMTWTYSTDQIPEASSPGMLKIERRFYKRVREGDTYHLKPLEMGEEVGVGDQIEVHLKINTRSQFEYMHLKDPKAAGFEAETLLSGWKRDPLWYYEEPRDSLTNLFISWLPHGEYILRYRLRPTKAGVYRIGASTLQSMYSPDMAAHSAGFVMNVVGE